MRRPRLRIPHRALAILAVAVAAIVLPAAPAAADVDDFVITDFQSDFFLSADENGNAVLRTVETIVAQFPDFDQNHGIERAIPNSYDGHPTDLEILSVTDAGGQSLDWHEPEDSTDGYLVMRVGDADRYVRGTQTYVITYLQHNVVRQFDDTNAQEFYWDVNGDQWRVPMASVTARLHVDPAVAGSLTGSAACYQGFDGASDDCTSESEVDAAGEVAYEATATGIQPFQTLTIAVAFEKGTFVERSTSPWASVLFYFELFFGAIAVAFGVGAIVLRRTTFAHGRGRPTIVAEYLPPKDANVIVSSIVLGKTKRAVAAQLIDLAVRRNIRIIEEPSIALFSSRPNYTLQLVTADGLKNEELRLAQAFLGGGLQPGATKTLKKSDTVLAREVYSLMQGFKSSTEGREYFKKVPFFARFGPMFFGFGAAFATVFLFFAVVGDAREALLPGLVALAAVVSYVIVLAVVVRKPLTEKGAELRDYLTGLELYIRVAEQKRIEILQSPQGAERTPVDTADKAVMLKLYERVLPYAVLFNQERQWAKTLGDFYDNQPPEWYSGSSAFNTAAFATGISSVSSIASTAYSTSSSSSSGGSSGGGSSGGGGGGGGGGGW